MRQLPKNQLLHLNLVLHLAEDHLLHPNPVVEVEDPSSPIVEPKDVVMLHSISFFPYHWHIGFSNIDVFFSEEAMLCNQIDKQYI